MPCGSPVIRGRNVGACRYREGGRVISMSRRGSGCSGDGLRGRDKHIRCISGVSLTGVTRYEASNRLEDFLSG